MIPFSNQLFFETLSSIPALTVASFINFLKSLKAHPTIKFRVNGSFHDDFFLRHFGLWLHLWMRRIASIFIPILLHLQKLSDYIKHFSRAVTKLSKFPSPKPEHNEWTKTSPSLSTLLLPFLVSLKFFPSDHLTKKEGKSFPCHESSLLARAFAHPAKLLIFAYLFLSIFIRQDAFRSSFGHFFSVCVGDENRSKSHYCTPRSSTTF